MRVLVIGGTGLTGRQVARQLLESGHQAAVLHRGHTEDSVLAHAIPHFHGDRRDVSFLTAVAREYQPTVVIDMTVVAPRDIEIAIHVFGNELERYTMISSADVYEAFEIAARERTDSAREPIPLPETARLRQGRYRFESSDYDKIGAEHAALAACIEGRLPATIVRFPAIYGEGAVREWYWVKRVLDGRTRVALPNGGLSIFHRGYCVNLARAAVLATERGETGCVYNAGDESYFSVQQLTVLIGELLGHQWEMVAVTPQAWPWGTPYSLESHLVLDISRLNSLGYRDIIPAFDALLQTVAYLRSNPPRHVNQLWPRAFDYAAEDIAMDG